MINPPFTFEQVRKLNKYQYAGEGHPFTCEYCRDKLGVYFYVEKDGSHRRISITDKRMQGDQNRIVIDDHQLVATTSGWICTTCDYTQDWAHEYMVEL